MNARLWRSTTLAVLLSVIPSLAQTPSQGRVPSATNEATPGPVQQSGNYVVGAHDVLIITSYDQPELTGKFTIETDGTFTYPYIGRVNAGGTTLRGVEAALKKELTAQGFFTDPQITVAIEQYRSQKVYLVGEVRSPGAYSMSGNMRLVEALALAGSTLPTASGEAVIVHASSDSMVVDAKSADVGNLPNTDPGRVNRVDLRELENGNVSQNVVLMNGDTVFVLRAENVYVFGQVRSPGAYPLRQRNTTVLQALSLAGGITERGATGRIQIVRIIDGKKVEIKAALTDFVEPRDTVIVPERFF